MSKSYFLPRKSKFYGFGLSVLLSFSWSGFFGCAETARKTANNPSVSNALPSESKANPSLNKSSQTAKKTKKDAKGLLRKPRQRRIDGRTPRARRNPWSVNLREKRNPLPPIHPETQGRKIPKVRKLEKNLRRIDGRRGSPRQGDLRKIRNHRFLGKATPRCPQPP